MNNNSQAGELIDVEIGIYTPVANPFAFLRMRPK